MLSQLCLRMRIRDKLRHFPLYKPGSGDIERQVERAVQVADVPELELQI